MNAPVARPQVTAFVAAVRAQLDDLSRDEVEELTDGLEADLADAVADSGAEPADLFGDPAAYAAELRSAAGLPPRAAAGGERRPGAATQLRGGVTAALDGVRSQPWWPGLRDFVVTLRPVWWVLRAAIAAAGLAVFFGAGSFLLFLLFAIVSVELGRRRLAGRSPGWRAVIAIGNGIAVFGLFMVTLAGGVPSLSPWNSPSVETVYGPGYGENGVWVDGSEVRNIFPYDSQGRPLTDVQLYDENGRPIAVGDSARTPLEDERGREHAQVPGVDAAGQQRWNVYPLRERIDTDPGDGSAPSPGVPQPASPPSVSPGALIVPWSPSPSPSPSPSTTVAPTVSPGATVSSTTPTASPAPTATTRSPSASRAG